MAALSQQLPARLILWVMPREAALLAHAAADAVLAVVHTALAQGDDGAGRAAGLPAGGELFAQGCGEGFVLAAARALIFAQMRVVAAAAGTEGGAGFGEVHGRIAVLAGVKDLDAPASCWATMAKAFFKMSF
jgi:hypothetical protein